MLVASLLVDLVWLIKASIPNFNFLVSLKVAQIYLPRVEWGGMGGWFGSHSDYNASLSSN